MIQQPLKTMAHVTTRHASVAQTKMPVIIAQMPFTTMVLVITQAALWEDA
jgi:uncharacterized membrane protein